MGYGYWGPNLARNLHQIEAVNIAALVDTDTVARRKFESTLGKQTFESVEDLNRSGLDYELAVIATRPSSHAELAINFLEKNKYVLVTKPAGDSLANCERIVRAESKSSAKVFYDYTYLYSPLYLKMKEIVDQGILGNLHTYTSYRTALGIVQSDVDVLADLLTHDLSILISLLGIEPETIQVLNASSANHDKTRNALTLLRWKSGFRAVIHNSWESVKKNRYISLSGEYAALILEELNQESPMKIITYSENINEKLNPDEFRRRNISYTLGETSNIQVPKFESLSNEINTILSAITSQSKSDISIPNSNLAVQIWKVLESGRKSIFNGGVEIPIIHE